MSAAATLLAPSTDPGLDESEPGLPYPEERRRITPPAEVSVPPTTLAMRFRTHALAATVISLAGCGAGQPDRAEAAKLIQPAFDAWAKDLVDNVSVRMKMSQAQWNDQSGEGEPVGFEGCLTMSTDITEVSSQGGLISVWFTPKAYAQGLPTGSARPQTVEVAWSAPRLIEVTGLGAGDAADTLVAEYRWARGPLLGPDWMRCSRQAERHARGLRPIGDRRTGRATLRRFDDGWRADPILLEVDERNEGGDADAGLIGPTGLAPAIDADASCVSNGLAQTTKALKAAQPEQAGSIAASGAGEAISTCVKRESRHPAARALGQIAQVDPANAGTILRLAVAEIGADWEVACKATQFGVVVSAPSNQAARTLLDGCAPLAAAVPESDRARVTTRDALIGLVGWSGLKQAGVPEGEIQEWLGAALRPTIEPPAEEPAVAAPAGQPETMEEMMRRLKAKASEDARTPTLTAPPPPPPPPPPKR